jgi:hypothetical protein
MVMRAFVDIHSYYIKSDRNQSKRLEIEDVESFAMAQFKEIPPRLHVSYVCMYVCIHMHVCIYVRRLTGLNTQASFCSCTRAVIVCICIKSAATDQKTPHLLELT